MTKTQTDPTPFKGMPAAGFRLLAALEENNSLEWMRENSAAVEKHLKAPFVRFLEAATKRLAEAGSDLEGGAGTLFRMQRDARFLKDRPPFHEHVEGVLSKGGQRIGTRGSIHARLAKDGGFLGAGSFLLSSEAVHALREAMVARSKRFLSIAGKLEEAGCALTSSRTLKRAPRGFEDVKSVELARYLRLVSPVATRPLRPVHWKSERVLDETEAFAATCRPWILFMREALKEVPTSVAAQRPPRPARR